MIRDYRQMLVDVRERISKLKAAGKSEDEVVAAKPNADYDVKFRVDERDDRQFHSCGLSLVEELGRAFIGRNGATSRANIRQALKAMRKPRSRDVRVGPNLHWLAPMPEVLHVDAKRDRILRVEAELGDSSISSASEQPKKPLSFRDVRGRSRECASHCDNAYGGLE